MRKYLDMSVHVTPCNSIFRAANASVDYAVAAGLQTGGPLQVSWPNFAMPFSSWGLKGLFASGLPRQEGFFSSGDLYGAAYNVSLLSLRLVHVETMAPGSNARSQPFTADPKLQTRSSSETFLQQSIERGAPLTVYQMTQALNILFDDQKRATGVQVQSANRNYTLNARNEVILSAGAFHSPQLLMVSGIGPQNVLQQHDIPVLANRPGVGQNMHDSCNAGGVTFPVSVISTAIRQRDPEYEARAIEQFRSNGSGILTNGGGDVLSFEKLPDSHRSRLSNATRERLAEWPADWPETEYVLSSSGKTLEGSSATDDNYVSIGILLVGALSRGNVTIRSNSMFDKPVISTNWLLDEADQEVAVQAYRRIREFWSHVEIKTGPEEAPGSNVTSDADLLEYIRGAVSPIHHASSTCRFRAQASPVVGTETDKFGRYDG